LLHTSFTWFDSLVFMSFDLFGPYELYMIWLSSVSQIM
jgi:hypothetical protein